MCLDKVQHLIREGVGGIELRSLNRTATRSGDKKREFIKEENGIYVTLGLSNNILFKGQSRLSDSYSLLFSIKDS